MNENFKRFKETGKIEYYLKYKEEVSKEFNKGNNNEANKDKRNSIKNN